MAVKCDIKKHVGLEFATSPGVVHITLFNELKKGHKFGQLSIGIVERLKKARDMKAWTPSIVHSVITHWTKPFHTMAKPMLQVYQVRMETGDMYSAFLSSFTYLWICLWIGCKLSFIKADAMGYCHHLECCEHAHFWKYHIICLKMTQKLMGKSNNPLTIDLEHMETIDSVHKALGAQGADQVIPLVVNITQLQLAIVFCLLQL
jgi:hypothetical protein